MLTFSLETQKRLADTLLAISDGERQIEVIRQILCEQIDFEPYAAFRRIDRLRRGSINAIDILKFLSDNNIYHYTDDNCQAFINRYDIDGDNHLSYNEFLCVVLPMDNPTLRTIAAQRPTYDVDENQFLAYEVEHALSKVFDREISFYISIDYKKNVLLDCRDFNYQDAFATVDYHCKKINFINLENFFRKLGIYPAEEEIIALLRRFDRDDDGCVKYNEFVLGLEPANYLVKRGNSKLTIAPTSPQRVLSPSRKTTGSSLGTSMRMMTDGDLIRTAVSPSRTNKGIQRVTSPLRQMSPLRTVSSPLRNGEAETGFYYYIPSSKRVTSPQKRLGVYERSITSDKGRNKYENTPTSSSFFLPYHAKRVEVKGYSSPVKLTNTSTEAQYGFRTISSSTWGVGERVSSRSTTFNGGGVLNTQTSPLKKSHFKGTEKKSPWRQGGLTLSTIENEEEFNVSAVSTAINQNGGEKLFERSLLKKKRTNTSISQNITDKKDTKLLSEKERKTTNGNGKFEESEAKAGLIDVLKQFIIIEKELEIGKQDLSLRPDFNLLDFFRIFDTEGRGFISSHEISEGLKRFGVEPTKEELYLFLRRYDRDNDGKMKFSDFTEAFTCKQQEYANILNTRTAVNADLSLDIDEIFSGETKKTISKVLRKHFGNEGTTEGLRQQLAKKYNFNLHEGFSYLDLNADGAITIEEISEILDKNDFYATQKELKLLMDRLDANKDGKITYSEFVQEMAPKSEKVF